MIDIRTISYELYKQDWVNYHKSRESVLDNIRNWGHDCLDNNPMEYEEFVEEFGDSVHSQQPRGSPRGGRAVRHSILCMVDQEGPF